VPCARDQCGDVLILEAEVGRHGRGRGAAVEAVGGRELSSEAACGGVGSAWRSAEGRDPKNG